jgi:hypothetical protein
MSKKKIIGIITTFEDYDSILNLNKKLYDQICLEFGTLYIINLKNITIFEKKTYITKKKILNRKIIVFEPKNIEDFISFFKNKKLIAFNALSRNFDNFKIYYYLNKISLIQILLLNIGFLSNSSDILNKNLKSLIYSFFFKFNKNISRIIFKIGTIFQIFPRIDYYLDASKPTIKNVNKSFLKKLENKFPCLKLAYFKKGINLNSRAYDETTDNKKKTQKYIVFVDTYFDHPDRIAREGKINRVTILAYYKRLSNFLILLSKIYNKKIVICIHPKNKSILFNQCFAKFSIKKHKTTEMINNAFIVLFHESSAALNAVLLDKNIIILKSKLMGDYLSKRIEMYINLLGSFYIDLDDYSNLKKNDLDINMKKSKKKYRTYIKNYLNSDGKIPGYKKVVNIIKKISK